MEARDRGGTGRVAASLEAAARSLARPVARWYRYLPTARKLRLRRLWYWPLDELELRTGRRNPLLPPRGLRFVGRGDFTGTGKTFRDYFQTLGGLQPNHRVLDVGCGVGRMAVPLTEVIRAPGSYDGFDTVREAVVWCQGAITPRFPGFRFEHLDVANRRYNPAGRLDAREVTFPYGSAAFDFVIVTSVFTHLAPAAAERYVAEIARVLRGGGRILATFFLLNRDSERLLAAGASELRFDHPLGSARTMVAGDPDFAVALPESEVREAFRRHALRIDEPVHYGDWCGRAEHLDHQDIILATRDGGTG